MMNDFQQDRYLQLPNMFSASQMKELIHLTENILAAKRQLEFNKLMLAFYTDNNPQPMTDFMLSCLSSELINIMTEF